MKARDAQKLRNWILIIGFIIIFAGHIWEPLTIIGAFVTLSCLVPDLLYNKCPHCGKRLGLNEGKFCQHCGEKIDG